jgi:hypothetical protein
MLSKPIVILLLNFISFCSPIENGTEKLKIQAKEAFSYCKEKNMDTNHCFLVDFSIHSGKYRFYIWDFEKQNKVASSLCCHGMGGGSTEETPVFSNKEGSYCSSYGKYAVGKKAYSKWGINIHYKLKGLEPSNNNAYKRIIVLHSYDPVSEDEIFPEQLPMGWSLGCPVVSNQTMRSIEQLMKKKSKPVLLWIYK